MGYFAPQHNGERMAKKEVLLVEFFVVSVGKLTT